jgi:catechol 2,3-dioxygenase-like lactoylglutathione lyase family enzyme
MKMKLELVPVPVTDVDRAKSFYVDQVGFQADLDVRPNEAVRIVQLTPPESACSIVIGTGLPGIAMPPGSLRGLHLVVGNVAQAREALISRGVEVSEVEEHDQGVKYAYFSDPDGNTWALQEMSWRSSEF